MPTRPTIALTGPQDKDLGRTVPSTWGSPTIRPPNTVEVVPAAERDWLNLSAQARIAVRPANGSSRSSSRRRQPCRHGLALPSDLTTAPSAFSPLGEVVPGCLALVVGAVAPVGYAHRHPPRRHATDYEMCNGSCETSCVVRDDRRHPAHIPSHGLRP